VPTAEGPWRTVAASTASSVRQQLVYSVTWGATASSAADAQPDTTPPRHLPAQAIDYVSGYLLAFGTMVALRRALKEGQLLVQYAGADRPLDRRARPDRALTRLPPPTRFEDVQDLPAEAESLRPSTLPQPGRAAVGDARAGTGQRSPLTMTPRSGRPTLTGSPVISLCSDRICA
jgi:hypothetical protein